MNNFLLDCEYFPCVGWYQLLVQSDQVMLEQYEYFERTSFRNRCVLAGPNQTVTLSVPLQGGRNQKIRMKDVKVSYDDAWPVRHFKTIASIYQRSPYYMYYEDEIRCFFQQKPDYLLDVNIASIQLINRLLKLNKDLPYTNTYEENGDQHFIDARKRFTARTTQEVSVFPTYWQTFEDRNGFIPNLSILDMLFCCGNTTVSLLSAAKK
ncbi:MAG TPA: WbqC family protein [Chitinophagaceae bacterium]|nr:WbqC family protein [Chitinophagaceae bacterium]